jgi:hypothetical protein
MASGGKEAESDFIGFLAAHLANWAVVRATWVTRPVARPIQQF